MVPRSGLGDPAVTNDSGLLLIALGMVLVLGPATKYSCHRLRVPVAAGYIVLGLALGTAFRQLGDIDTPTFTGAFAVLAQLGVVALLFRVGLTSHISVLLAKLPDASVIWIVNVAGTFAAGYAVSRYALGWSLETGLVVGTAFSATSIAVSLAVWDELGQANSDTGATLLDVAELDDLSAAVLLAVLLGTLPILLNGEAGVWQRAGASSFSVL
ncbi:MAG TPA: cation:proton antiporter, partial [Pseudomonadales bacterium]